MSTPATLAGSYVISLRPQGQHAALRRAAARHGACLIALSPLRIERCSDASVRGALRMALAAERVVFTSPNAVRAAAALQRLRARSNQTWLAVGAGTAAALRRAGIAGCVSPARMDSSGLLALPDLQALRGRDVGLVTAPGGRNRIAPALRARGTRVLRADVYVREPVPLRPQALQRLRASGTAPLLLALSSGEALQQLMAELPADLHQRVLRAQVLAASPRLAALARRHGFDAIRIAASARPGDLLAAALAT